MNCTSSSSLQSPNSNCHNACFDLNKFINECQNKKKKVNIWPWGSEATSKNLLKHEVKLLKYIHTHEK